MVYVWSSGLCIVALLQAPVTSSGCRRAGRPDADPVRSAPAERPTAPACPPRGGHRSQSPWGPGSSTSVP